MEAQPGGRARRVAARLALSLLGTALLLELGARVLLFSDAAQGWPLAVELRRPERLSHPTRDLYWILQDEFNTAPLLEVPEYDPQVGWLGGFVHLGAWRHPDADALGGRRAVLLYGDSYAACVVPRGSCFQDFLEAGPLGAEFRILNHGVGGYGLDQAALLLEATVDRYRELDPLVLVGVLVDEDLDRCALSFRGWPKPRFERGSDGWEARPAARERPRRPFWVSYGLHLVAHQRALAGGFLHEVICPLERTAELNRERCRVLVARTVERLRARGLESFFVLFFAQRAVADPDHTGWREPFLVQLLDELGMPWVSTRGPLRSNAAQSGRALDEYYLANGHLSPLGNEVALRAITEGLQGRFGVAVDESWSEAELAGALSPDQIAAVVLGGPKSAARYEYGFRPPFGRDEADRSRLCFHATGEGATEVHYDLGGRARAFEASAKFIPMEKLGPGEGSVQLALVADGEVLLREQLVRGDPPLALRVDLTGRRRLVIAVDTAGDGQKGDWLVLSSPRFR